MDTIYSVLKHNRGYLKKGNAWLSNQFNASTVDVRAARAKIKDEQKRYLIISDLHIPFEHKDALAFCKDIKDKWDCTDIVFVGDVLDLHFSSYHGVSSRASSADQELALAKEAIKEWYYAFPEAKVCLGNHDRIIYRKAEDEGISNEWIKSPSEVLDVPNWKFNMHWEFPNFVVTHGTDGKNMKAKLYKYGNKSIVQGHYHTESKIEYVNEGTWTMQLGALIDKKAYAFEYARNTSRNTILSVGVVVNGVPIIETM